MIMMLMIIIINCMLSLLSVPGEYQAAARCCHVRFVGLAYDDAAVWGFNEAYLLALGVQGRGRLVQEQDLGVTYDRSGDGDALLLSARQLRTLGADVCVVFLKREQRRFILNVLNFPIWTAMSYLL